MCSICSLIELKKEKKQVGSYVNSCFFKGFVFFSSSCIIHILKCKMTSERKHSLIETILSDNHPNDDHGSIPEKRWRRASFVTTPLVRFTLFFI